MQDLTYWFVVQVCVVSKYQLRIAKTSHRTPTNCFPVESIYATSDDNQFPVLRHMKQQDYIVLLHKHSHHDVTAT